MPYRRLPNTDQARFRALKNAIEEHEKNNDVNNPVIPHKLIIEAKAFLNRFEKNLYQYKQALETQVSENKKYQVIVRNARLYISHFIQVLNLSVIRNEIKNEHKVFYKLDLDNHAVPDLSTEVALLEWGENLIKGERERCQNGGTAMYNPTIAKVQVHFDRFKENKVKQNIFQQSTHRFLNGVAEMRHEGDAIIQGIWNMIEQKYENLPPYSRMKACQKYGIVYYYRRGEAELTPEDDIQQRRPEPDAHQQCLFENE